jgi:hypothetical protein
MRKPAAGRDSRAPGGDDVETFVAARAHPLTPVLQALRAIVRAAVPAFVEGIKWNAPSYRVPPTEDVLTFNLGAPDRVRLILHRGAKAAAKRTSGRLLAEDGGLLEWAANDRAIATFRTLADVKAGKAALTKLVRAWVRAIAR